MAKCSAHGYEIGTIAFLAHSKRYMSDGVVLVNHGNGWKLKGKLKAGLTPQAAYDNCKKNHDDWKCRHPLTNEYIKRLHAVTSMANRWKLHTAIQMMPDDPDGVWAEACDGYGNNVHADVDEIAEVCRAYRAALSENDIMKQAIEA